MKQKILFILHIPPPINGAAMVGQYIKESSVINTAFDADHINLATSFQLGDIGKGGYNKVIATFKILKLVYEALKTKKYDLCYLTLTAKGAGFYKDFLVVLLLKLKGQRIIYHFHNKGVSQNSRNVLNHLLYKITFRNAQCIQLSPLLYKDIAKYVAQKDVQYCPNGVEEFPNTHKKNVDLEKVRPCRLLFLSNMMEEKGVWDLLDACCQLKKRELDFECHFIGAWSDVKEGNFKEKVRNLELEKLVYAHGKKYGEDKNTYFYNSDIFVFPTYYHNECFPLVLLEAMQFSLAVVSTNEGGIADIVEHGQTGLLVEKNNIKELVSALEYLILNPKIRNRMGKEGYLRYKNSFTKEVFENNLKNILKRAIHS